MTIILDGTNGETFPSWTTATRPASPAVGQMGYNTTTGQFDAYTSNGWVSVATSGTSPVNGPAFGAYAGSSTTFTAGVQTKVLFDTEEFDTNNNFASSRFTPTVAGYYQINASIVALFPAGESSLTLYKNGSGYKNLLDIQGAYSYTLNGSCLVYLNGTTDYIELYCYSQNGTSSIIGQNRTWCNGYLARGA